MKTAEASFAAKLAAGGNIGIQQVAKAAPDGYSLLLVSSAFVIKAGNIKSDQAGD